MMPSMVRSALLKKVLRRIGWAAVGSFRDSLQYWEPVGSGDHKGFDPRRLQRVILPVLPSSDAEDLLDDAYHYLLQEYGVAFERALETVQLVQREGLDEIEVVRETGNSSGLIQWERGGEAINGLRGILASAAKATAESRKRFANADSIIAEEFLSGCYMGQTRVGSYVVSALTPAEKLLHTSRSEKNSSLHPRYTGRAVTQRLEEALTAVRTAIDEFRSPAGDIEIFDETIGSGVSFELLDALTPLTMETESGIGIKFEPLGQLDDDVPRAIEFSFTPADGEVVARAREHLRVTPSTITATIVGEVTNLKNSSSASERQVKLATAVNGRPRVVSLELNDQQYESAIEAHSTGHLLSVRGELEIRSRGAYLSSPEFVKIEPVTVRGIERTFQDESSVTPSQAALWDDQN